MMKNNFYKFTNKKFYKFNIFLIIIGIVLVVGVVAFFPHLFRNTYVVTISNKQIKTYNNSDIYLIYAQTDDGKIITFNDTDSALELKLNSENLYWELRINKKYEIKTYGLNIPLISSYENIIWAKGVN